MSFSFVKGRRWRFAVALAVFFLAATFGAREGFLLWHIRSARASLSSGSPDRALDALHKITRLAGENAEVLFLLGRASRRADKLDAVYPYLDRAVRAGWPEDEVRHQRYLTLVQSGNLDQAGSYLEEVLRKGVDDDLAEEVYEARTKGFLTIYNLKDALLCIDYWLRWRPHARQARMWRAEIWERTSLWGNAIADYRAILEHNSDDFDARLKLADALLWEQDVKGALREYDVCVAMRPGNAAAQLGRVKSLRRTGASSEARSALRTLLEKDLTAEQKAEVLFELGEIALLNQDYAQAADFLSRSRAADPANRQVYHPLSQAYARLGKRDLADEAERRGEETTRRVTRLSEIVKEMVGHPDDPELRYEAGMLFFEEGAPKDGAAWLHTALRCDPNHRKTHAALADYYEKSGDVPSARHHRSMAEARSGGERASQPELQLP
jgi:tetratricopeptide (TPR) repeat protein